jgi:hypothetical protein
LSYLSWLLFGFYPSDVSSLWLFPWQALAHQKWILDENLIEFLVLEVLPVYLL